MDKETESFSEAFDNATLDPPSDDVEESEENRPANMTPEDSE